MEDRFRKVSCITSAEIAPPILLRRRLSAPETIMRKHLLAQQRSSSQDSDGSQNSETTQSWPMDPSSDPNLSKRRENDIRRSTLMRRFWESSRLQFPRTYSEWQHSFGKMKLSSSPSTPEHNRGSRKSIFEIAKQRRVSDATQVSPKRKMSVYSGNYADRKNSVEESPKHMRKISPWQENFTRRESLPKKEYSPRQDYEPKNLEESDESYMIYSSNFSNITSTESNGNTTSRTIDESTVNFDSAYSNSGTNKSTETPDNKAIHLESNIAAGNIPDLPIKYQFVLRETSGEFVPKAETTNESTQTTDTTNLNVISNVHLSQSTLNLIFNQVMQDVLQSKSPTPETPQPKLINVQKLPTFNITTKKEEEEIIKPKKMISEVTAGSPYKIKESPLVPRLSALPRSTSMEVNISSNDSFEKESDSGSLVDSLDDPSSPKVGKTDYDDKLVRGDLALLPDNSKPKVPPAKKPSVFYIPMQKNEEVKMVMEENNGQDVSSLLPSKLKERLMKRQMKREEKKKENKIRTVLLDGENGNLNGYLETSPELNSKPKTRKKKTTLPLIENKKEKSSDSEKEKVKARDKNKNKESYEAQSSKTKSFWLPKAKQLHHIHHKIDKTPLTGRIEKESKKFYHKETCKQIEILEIMEIVEPQRVLNLTPKIKSKIPVLVQHKLPKLVRDQKPPNPTFLDFGNNQSDPKLDQLIANILIDTLNREECAEMAKGNKNGNGRKFDTIPEERAEQNNNPNLIEKAAEILTQQVLENNNLDLASGLPQNVEPADKSNIPKGWITFYMLQKNNSPESTSDEGPKAMATKLPKTHNKKYNKPKDSPKDSDYKTEDYFESDSETEASSPKYATRKNNEPKCGWSVTVSGKGTGGNGPDVEMRLKFPQLPKKPVKHRRQSKHEYATFPLLSNKTSHKETGISFEDICNRQSTEIRNSKAYLKNNEKRSRENTTVIPSKYQPRPTKTSTQRRLLNRPKKLTEISVPLETNSRSLEDIFKKFPNILAVNGNALSREKRKTLPKMSESDLKHFLSQFNNQNVQ